MPIETVFADLSIHLESLRGSFKHLRATIQHRPLQGDVVLVDLLGDAVDDALGWLEEAIDAAGDGQAALRASPDLDLARRHLAVCQERFQEVAQRCSADLLPYGRLADLAHFGREKPGPWRMWARDVKRALDGCQQPLFEVNQALFRCWQTLAEQAVMATVPTRVDETESHARIEVRHGAHLGHNGPATSRTELAHAGRARRPRRGDAWRAKDRDN